MRRGHRWLIFLGSVAPALVLLLFVHTLSSSAAVVAEPASQRSVASVRLLFANDQRIGFSLVTPVSLPVDGTLDVPGLDQRTVMPGLPALPFYSTYIVLPPESTPRLAIKRAEPATKAIVSLPAAPVEIVDAPPLLGGLPPPSAIVADRAGGHAASLDARIRENDVTASPAEVQAGLFPSQLVEISEPIVVRDVRLLRVSIFPVQYDPGQHLLSITPELELVIDFQRTAHTGPARPAPSVGDQHLASIANVVLNPEQIPEFRGLPLSMDEGNSGLPLGVDLYEIGVVTNGVHALTYQALQDAGMPVDEVDPAWLEMMYRGQPVATDFSGDSDAVFEPGESLRFFGQVFNGSRLERQFIDENIYWLWAGGQARPLKTVASVVGQPVTSFLASLTHEPETIYFQGFTADWPENEPDAWYWDWWRMLQDPLTRTYTVTLPNPAPAGPAAQFTAEFSGRDSHVADQTHSLAVTMNSYPSVAARSWLGERNFNVSASVPLTAVLNGANHFDVRAQTEGTSAYVALNRITVDYQRTLQAVDDQLIFSDQLGGLRQYQVRGFSHDRAADFLAWDVTDPYSPTAILTSSLGISGNGPYTVTFGRQSAADAGYILTTVDNLIAPASISSYVAPQIDPPGGAQWVAIAYKDFMTETRRLAGHRSQAQFGGLTTHVVDIEHITNQYGYGLPVPAAIHDYLSHALSTWSVKPSYVVLVGDTTLDPRHIKSDWTDQQYVPTDLPFVDRYNGQIPSDLTFALVSGADILPDLAVGRLAAETVDELTLMVDKIIRYDENQRLSFGWMQNMLFVADKYDPAAANFCAQDVALANRLPPSLNSELLCLDDYANGGTPDDAALRADMFTLLEDTGVTMLTYRGHGAINYWGGDPLILSLNYALELKNHQPFVVISGDCLDGHYAYPPYEGLGERLVNFWTPAADTYGAAAHWGSSGLGLASDHTDILNGFYDGLFSAGATALGDAVNYAKLAYYLDPYNDPALMYSFNLQGDPAMQLMRPSIELQGAWQQQVTKANRQVTLTLTVRNHGLYPSPVTLVGQPVTGFSVAAITSTVANSAAIAGDGARIALQFGQQANGSGIPRNGQATVTVTYDVGPDAEPGLRLASFIAETPGLEAWPGDEQVTEQIIVIKESIWLPTLRR